LKTLTKILEKYHFNMNQTRLIIELLHHAGAFEPVLLEKTLQLTGYSEDRITKEIENIQSAQKNYENTHDESIFIETVIHTFLEDNIRDSTGNDKQRALDWLTCVTQLLFYH